MWRLDHCFFWTRLLDDCFLWLFFMCFLRVRLLDQWFFFSICKIRDLSLQVHESLFLLVVLYWHMLYFIVERNRIAYGCIFSHTCLRVATGPFLLLNAVAGWLLVNGSSCASCACACWINDSFLAFATFATFRLIWMSDCFFWLFFMRFLRMWLLDQGFFFSIWGIRDFSSEVDVARSIVLFW